MANSPFMNSESSTAGRCGDVIIPFVSIYEHYYRPVFAYIYSRLNEDVEVARDLTADVFERVYLKSASIRNPSSLQPWIYAVARNRVRDYLRRITRAPREVDLVLIPNDFLFDGQTGPEEKVLKGELLERLKSCIRRLSAPEQEVLSLKFDAGLDSSEIGKVMGRSRENVRVTLFRALKRLRRMLETEEEGKRTGLMASPYESKPETA